MPRMDGLRKLVFGLGVGPNRDGGRMGSVDWAETVLRWTMVGRNLEKGKEFLLNRTSWEI